MRALTREEKRAAFQELTSLTAYRPAENSLILSAWNTASPRLHSSASRSLDPFNCSLSTPVQRSWLDGDSPNAGAGLVHPGYYRRPGHRPSRKPIYGGPMIALLKAVRRKTRTNSCTTGHQ